ncbi:MAG TPA: hypothetical protein VKA18_14130 [Alphaproteobacteria bacterium]|nr:hypothetical protein [Alphaproteobacteria bacterium]
MRADLPESPVTLEEYGAMTMEERRRVWLEISAISETEFDAHMAREKAREANVPGLGSMAPDFTAERLDKLGRRTGEMVRLSDFRGRPVALAFGSYT